ncbi:MAG: hypothetical protein NVSMB6_07060 [Burkholderiaceae bacterium]
MLAHNDAHADQIEAMLDDDSVDVIVGSASLNIMELIEDEALLALSPAPKHEECPPEALPAGVGLGATKLSPFAVLKTLKH